MARVIVFGHGTIGRHLVKKLPEYGHEPVLIVTRSGIRRLEGPLIAGFQSGVSQHEIGTLIEAACEGHGIQHGLLAIPSGADGSVELGYMLTLLQSGIPVVTAGKSALANRFDDLRDWIGKVGHDAACGGGTMIPSFIRSKLHIDHRRPACITLNVNGTLNFACWRFSMPAATEEGVCDEAARLLFAEPTVSGEAPTPAQLFSGELGDIQRKIAIVFNTCLYPLVGRAVTQADFPTVPLGEKDLRRVTSGNVTYRYLVRICMREADLDYFEEVLEGGSIRVRIGDIWVVAGFLRIEGVLEEFARPMAGNAVRISQGGDSNFTDGEGAGPVPTVGAMMMNMP